jgi:drug/metabolite transporter (DMT)-like permease
MPNKLSHRGAVILMIVTATLWSIAGVFTRHLDSAKGFEVTFWRSLFAGLFVLVAMLKQYGRGFVPRRVYLVGWDFYPVVCGRPCIPVS